MKKKLATFLAALLCMAGTSAWAEILPMEPLKAGDYYEIGSDAELVWFSNFVNESTDNVKANAKLTADIDMSSVANFTPIGKTAHSGTYNDTNIAFK